MPVFRILIAQTEMNKVVPPFTFLLVICKSRKAGKLSLMNSLCSEVTLTDVLRPRYTLGLRFPFIKFLVLTGFTTLHARHDVFIPAIRIPVIPASANGEIIFAYGRARFWGLLRILN